MSPVREAVEHEVPPRASVPFSYWDSVASDWHNTGDAISWRMVSDAVNARLLERWLPANPLGSVLKTDLFDEVASAGLVPLLSNGFGCVSGIDISPSLVEKVRARYPELHAEVADVRSLPFADNSFDAVVSNSTLDHFPSLDDVSLALGELHRVLRAGGRLLVTLDNPRNPAVAVRNALPERVRRATGLVPFAVGATCGPRRLRALLERTGFEVERMSAVFHSPRLLVVLAGRLVDRGGPALKRRYVRLCARFEALDALPTRFLTGHFVAALARKS